MKLYLGGINGNYLRNITENSAYITEEVLAAVAYATDAELLFDWCWKHSIPLKFYGRLDDSIAVSLSILRSFLNRKSARFECSLIQHHHAKVIWWRGVGVYIGSANLSARAWYSNVEAGCFIPEPEIDTEIGNDLLDMFATLQSNSTPLTEELFNEMEKRKKALDRSTPDSKEFWSSPSFTKWPGLVTKAPKSVQETQRSSFLEEWHATLQILRDIGEKVSDEKYRPSWVSSNAPSGALADQFLHAHYYNRTFVGRKANYEEFFHDNTKRRDEALLEAITWWSDLPAAPSEEDTMLNERAPFLQDILTRERLAIINEEEFRSICEKINAMREYARRVPNRTVGLPEDGSQYTIPEKIAALSHWIWNSPPQSGARIKSLLDYLLYGGDSEQLPERLWQSVTDPNRKLSGVGISALGEIVGWAMPDRFPPRNGRTSKSLRSLGYDVRVHV